MVYSGIYLSPKLNSSTIKSEQNSSNLSTSNQPNVTGSNVSSHRLKHSSKKLSSTGSTSNRSSESSRFNETNSNVTIKSDIAKFSKSAKLPPEIIFLIKEHAKTLETINQISKKLQEIELKVDDISQRLSKESSLNCSYPHLHHKPVVNSGQNDRTTSSDTTTTQQTTKIDHQKELNQTSHRLPAYSTTTYKEDHLSNQNLSNNATNIPNHNQILSDDSGGEYGNKTTTKTVSDDDELLSILEKITKCSHHILQTQQAYQQQGAAIYSSLSKPYAYSQQQQISNQFNQPAALQHHHLQSSQQYHADVYANLQQQQQQHQPPPQPNLYSVMNPYLLNAKLPIKTTTTTNHQPSNIHPQLQQQTLVPFKYNTSQHLPTQQQTASLNELLFEPNVERFLSNLDQLVSNDDTNLAAILGTSNQQSHQQQTGTHLIQSTNLPNLHPQQHQFIPVTPHQPTPITSQQILMNNNLRTNCLNPASNMLNTNYPLGGHMINMHSSINQPYVNNISSLHHASPNHNFKDQMYLNASWQKAKELLEKKERERIDTQLKMADDWLGMVDNCINRNKYSQSSTATKQSTTNSKQQTSQGSTKLVKGDKNDHLKKFDE